MADETPPLDEALNAIAAIRHDDSDDDAISWQVVNRQLVRVVRAIGRAKAEVDRLRAREAALVEIAETVAKEYADYCCDIHTGYRCGFCHVFIGPADEDDPREPEDHKPACPVTKARALLAQE